MASLMLAALPTATPRSLNFCSRFSSFRSESGVTPIVASFDSLTVSASSSSPSSLPLVACGRGDRRTAKGKRFSHSFGNARPRNKKKGRGPPRIPVPASPLSPDAPLNPDELVEDTEEEASTQVTE
ncbi:30S ribosomal protein S31, chloroplastic [Linum grandiflorum]